ncbi:hypothetical protein GCM10010103_30880 [Streptomyces paradoxus]|uniref:ATP-binding protein n=1 Tax=Streptomyces paradoxus TaxID=66375 RepID=A0A7W9TB74_9ACTN|nr:hypothetical protein [Streptomyces paradoxus]MBB6077454.1 hypothetical protein [Streptomyces paradoxus]
MTEPHTYWTELDRLLRLADGPDPTAVHAEIRTLVTSRGDVPSDSSVADWVKRGMVPRTDDKVVLLVSALETIARRRNPSLRIPPTARWRALAAKARAERGKGTGPALVRPAASPVSDVRSCWEEAVTHSPAWRLLRPGAAEQAEPLKARARNAAGRLAELYDEARAALAEDPWHDVNLARRISRWTNWFLDLPRSGGALLLSPAEAALVSLLPFLHQTHRTRTAAELSHVDPTDLGQRTSPDTERRMFEVLLGGHERLVRRAELGALRDRPDGRREIGWWLFHQWAGRQPGRLPRFLSAMGTEGTGLEAVLDPEPLSRLLGCAHSGPNELFDAARPDHLREDPYQLDFDGRDFQDVRERLVGSVFAVAHGMAVETTDLSSVIVRHVGIPDPLDPAKLLTTVDKASWQPRGEGIGLRARCGHPAVVAALTEHTRRLESLLRAVRRAAAPDFDALPLYTGAEEVREVDAEGRAVPVGGVIRFRLDEERVQELLMGENLYRDRSLAIRELYQNALDACRYRKARSEATETDSGYRGRIEFTQGYDEEEDRHYLECRDNGVGMDEITLSEVFSQAGVRFTDLPRFQEERQEWQSRGVTMHPNSRFGIGVLSYFMLADEIRVTTCHMNGVDGRLREITVLISGPGHYFRVRPTGSPGSIGTTVRLYLRDGEEAPSCVRELRRLLGIAEFATTARQGRQTVVWEPGVLRPREALALRSDGFEAHGHLVSWQAGPDGEDGQVVWCRHGGGVLVDGIYAEPRVLRGVLTAPGDQRALRGAVVNLTGRTRPRRLSVDRTEILDADVCADVEALLRAAFPALLSADPPILDVAWLSEIAGRSPRLADIVTEAARAAGHEMELHGHLTSMAATGFFPQDALLVHRSDSRLKDFEITGGETPAGRVIGTMDDHLLLWRLLAHRPNAELTALTAVVPELDRVERVLPALPSDVLACTPVDGDWNQRHWPFRDLGISLASPGHALFFSTIRGIPYREALERMRELRLQTPPAAEEEPVIDDINLALLSHDLAPPFRSGIPMSLWIDSAGPVPPGHLLKARLEFGMSLREAARRMRGFGFTVVEPDPSAEDLDERALVLLSWRLNGRSPWLEVNAPVPPGHLLKACRDAGIDLGTAVQWLRWFGFTVTADAPLLEARAERTLRLVSDRLQGEAPLDPEKPVPLGHVLHAAAELQRPVSHIVRELRALGFHPELVPAGEEQADHFLQRSREWGWGSREWHSLREETAIPPGVLARVSAAQGVPLHEMSRGVEALGLPTPSALPPMANDTDVVILSARADARPPWIRADDVVTAHQVVRAALESGLRPAEVADRLRAYGLVPPDVSFPPSAEPRDDILLGTTRRFGPPGEPLSPDRPVSVHHVVMKSSGLGLPPRAVVDRLAQYGLLTTLDTAPEDAYAFDQYLLGLHEEMQLPLEEGRPVPLHHLVSVIRKLPKEPHEIAQRLTAFGFRVPEDRIGRLDETDHRLCRVERGPGKQNSCLGLKEPISDFLLVARRVALPAKELVERLEGLDVDLQRVRDAVLAALPEVPGLVMKQEPGGSARPVDAT